MNKVFDNKINLLKALAILVVVAGHLEFSLIPMFPPYSFQVVLFFFIAGMVYNDKYSFFEYFKRRFKTLMMPYILYCIFYLALTFALAPLIGKFWAMKPSIKNEFLMPFLTGHQIDLISPLWFVPQLFCSLLVFKLFNKLKANDMIKFLILLFCAFFAIVLSNFRENLYILFILRTLFSLLFIWLGCFYNSKIKEKKDIFNPGTLSFVLVLQAFLWLSNRDYMPQDGIGLSYILVWGEFDSLFAPILTSITGIYISLFLVDVFYPKVKNWSFLDKIGKNTYHIMANHLLVFNIITYSIFYFKHLPFSLRSQGNIYTFYFPLKTTYVYFVVGIVVCVWIGELLKFLKRKFTEK